MKDEEKEFDKRAALQLPFLGLPIAPPGGVLDPFGSYTGRPLDLEEKPVQDVDDL